MKYYLLTAVMMSAALSSQAINYEFGDLNATNKTCTLTGWTGAAPSGRLILPEQYQDAAGIYTVTKIKANALDNLTEVTTVVIPKGVTRIGDATSNQIGDAQNFNNCPNLVSFSVAAGNTAFKTTGEGILTNVSSKCIIRVPSKVTVTSGIYKMPATMTDICKNAFSGNSTIVEVDLSPNFEDTNSNYGFNGMSSLAFLSINGSADPKYYSVEYGVLYDKNKTKIISYPPMKKGESYTAPNTVKTVGDDAFANTQYLYSVTCSGATTYGKRAFAGSGITIGSISSRVTSIGEAMYKGCPRLTVIGFNKDLDIPKEFAADCPQLQRVSGTSMAIKIENRAFANCPKLFGFPFVAHTRFIGDEIFADCGFENVVYGESTYDGDNGYIGDKMLMGNKNLKEIDLTKVIIPTRDDAFSWGLGMTWDCPNIETVKFPALTKFWYNPNDLTPVFSVNVPIKHIEIGAFYPGQAPMFVFNKGEYEPNVFVKTTDALSDCCPLNKLFKREGNAVLHPNVYCEAYDMRFETTLADRDKDEYVIENSDYYVPGNTLENYAACRAKGCRLYETYLFISIDNNGKYSLMLQALEPNLVFEDVKVNGVSVGVPNSNNLVVTDMPYYAVQDIEVSYTIRGVKMLTKYPTKDNQSGVVPVLVSPEDVRMYDLQGRPVLRPASGQIVVGTDGKKMIMK